MAPHESALQVQMHLVPPILAEHIDSFGLH